MKIRIDDMMKEIYTELGPGYSERVYHNAVEVRLRELKAMYESERIIPIFQIIIPIFRKKSFPNMLTLFCEKDHQVMCRTFPQEMSRKRFIGCSPDISEKLPGKNPKKNRSTRYLQKTNLGEV